MIINQSYKFIFIHIPKAAGTSVTRYLSELTGPFDLEIGATQFGEAIQPAYSRRFGLRKHSTLTEIERSLGPELFDDFFIFTFVRNPLTRLVSAFNFLRQWPDYNASLREKIMGFESFSEFVKSGLFTEVPGPDGMFLPQITRLNPTATGKPDPRVKIYKIEEAEAALHDLRGRLVENNIKAQALPKSLPRSNVTSLNKDVEQKAVLAPFIQRAILDFYIDDFENLEYEAGF